VAHHLERGDQADAEPGDQRGREGEEQDAGVELDVGGADGEALGEGHQQAQARGGEEHSEGASSQRQHRALGQELADQPSAARPKRDAQD
jgi:hypothetical protein